MKNEKIEKIILLPIAIEDYDLLKGLANDNNRTVRRQAQFALLKWIKEECEKVDNNLPELNDID